MDINKELDEFESKSFITGLIVLSLFIFTVLSFGTYKLSKQEIGKGQVSLDKLEGSEHQDENATVVSSKKLITFGEKFDNLIKYREFSTFKKSGFKGVTYKGKVILKPKFDEITAIYKFDGKKYFLVIKNGNYFLLNSERKEIISFKKNCEVLHYRSEMLCLRLDGSPHFIDFDKDANIYKYDKVAFFEDVNKSIECFTFKKGEFGGVADYKTHKVIFKEKLDDIIPVKEFKSDAHSRYLCFLQKEKRWDFKAVSRNVLNKNAYQPTFDFEKIQFENGSILASQDGGNFGVVDTLGNIIIPYEYNRIIPTDNFFYKAFKDNNVHIYDPLGTNLSKNNLYEDGIVIYMNKGLYGFYNSKKNIDIDPQFDLIIPPYNGHIVFKKEGLFGALNLQGEEVISPKYKYLSDFNGSHFLYEINGQTGQVDVNGNEQLIYSKIDKVPEFILKAKYLKNGKSLFKSNSGWALYSSEFKRETAFFIFLEPVKYFSKKEYLLAKKDNKYGLLNQEGQVEVPLIYDMITTDCSTLKLGSKVVAYNPIQKTYVHKYKNGLSNCININTKKTLLPKSFKKISLFPDYIKCGKEIYNYSGEKIFESHKDYVMGLFENLFFCNNKNDNFRSLYNSKGSLLFNNITRYKKVGGNFYLSFNKPKKYTIEDRAVTVIDSYGKVIKENFLPKKTNFIYKKYREIANNWQLYGGNKLINHEGETVLEGRMITRMESTSYPIIKCDGVYYFIYDNKYLVRGELISSYGSPKYKPVTTFDFSYQSGRIFCTDLFGMIGKSSDGSASFYDSGMNLIRETNFKEIYGTDTEGIIYVKTRFNIMGKVSRDLKKWLGRSIHLKSP